MVLLDHSFRIMLGKEKQLMDILMVNSSLIMNKLIWLLRRLSELTWERLVPPTKISERKIFKELGIMLTCSRKVMSPSKKLINFTDTCLTTSKLAQASNERMSDI